MISFRQFRTAGIKRISPNQTQKQYISDFHCRPAIAPVRRGGLLVEYCAAAAAAAIAIAMDGWMNGGYGGTVK